MPWIIVRKSFRACVGNDVHPIDFPASETPVQTTDRIRDVALSEGWAEECDPPEIKLAFPPKRGRKKSEKRYWPPVPPLWTGETCALIASGPSLTPEQVEYVRGKCRVGVTCNSFRLAPWADLLYACDWGWWNKYEHPDDGGMSWREFPGLKVTQDARGPEAFPELLRVPSVNEHGLSFNPLRIHQGANSGFQLLNIAVLMGAKKIILLGYDCRDDEGIGHWHGPHPEGLNNPRQHNFDQWIEAFRRSVPYLEAAEVEVINCSPGSAIDCFPTADIREILK